MATIGLLVGFPRKHGKFAALEFSFLVKFSKVRWFGPIQSEQRLNWISSRPLELPVEYRFCTALSNPEMQHIPSETAAPRISTLP